MKNTRALLISLLVAIMSLMMVYGYIAKREQSLLRWATPVDVVVAARDIPEGTRLDESWLEVVQVPKKYMQPGAVTTIESAVDRAVTVPLLKGTQLLESSLISTGRAGISPKIPKDKRAFSLAAMDVTAVAGLLQPGDFVDVIATFEVGTNKPGEGAASEEVFTETLLENILVLAVNRNSRRAIAEQGRMGASGEAGNLFSAAAKAVGGGDAVATLTLSVSPEEVQVLNMAQEIGSLAVSLRSTWDEGEAVHPGKLSSHELLGTKKSVVPRSRPAWVEIRGSEQITRY